MWPWGRLNNAGMCRTFGRSGPFRSVVDWSTNHNTEKQVLNQYRDYFRKLRLSVSDIARLEKHVTDGLHQRKSLLLIKQEIEIKLRFLGPHYAV